MNIAMDRTYNVFAGICLAQYGYFYCCDDEKKKILRITFKMWAIVKEHIKMRSLVEKWRASAAVQKRRSKRLKIQNKEEEKFSKRWSLCYVHLIENFNDYIFRRVLHFL